MGVGILRCPICIHSHGLPIKDYRDDYHPLRIHWKSKQHGKWVGCNHTVSDIIPFVEQMIERYQCELLDKDEEIAELKGDISLLQSLIPGGKFNNEED